MRAKRGSSGLSGIIAIDKPAGVTSHDVVSRIRRVSGEGRVGHCGTLDPFATGLLLVCVGPATRLADHLMALRKTYLARIDFGAATDTDDVTGEVICTLPFDDALSSFDFAQGYLTQLIGEHQQIPPQYSAIKHEGAKAYDVARRGDKPFLEARSVEVFAAQHLSINYQGAEETNSLGDSVPKGAGERGSLNAVLPIDSPKYSVQQAPLCSVQIAHPNTSESLSAPQNREPLSPAPFGTESPSESVSSVMSETLLSWNVVFEVSKGTYIRALARDIACELGTCGHLAALRRTQSGGVSLTKAYSLEVLEQRGVQDCFLDPAQALGLPVLILDDERLEYVKNGRPLSCPPSFQEQDVAKVACVHGSSVWALYEYSEQHGDLRPLVVIPGGVSGVQ